MKHLLFALLSCLPFFANAQALDSTKVARAVDSLLQTCQTCIKQQDFDSALVVIKLAEDKAEAGLGKMSASYANCLHNHAVIYIRTGRFKDAEPFCVMAKEIRERVLGKEHLDYSLSVSYLATLYKELFQYDKAEALALEALDLRAKSPGKESREYAIVLDLLGVINYRLGNYDKSEPYFIEAKNIFAKKLGNKSAEYAQTLSHLATLYNDLGKYDNVEALYLEAKDGQEKSPGKLSVEYAATINNLAWFYFRTGQYIKAKQFFVEAETVFAKAFGTENPYYVTSLANLASYYYQTGEYGKAELLFLKAKDILEKTAGKENQYYAGNLTNLGALYSDVGQYKKAEAIFLEAKDILGKILGKNHPDYATILGNIANLYYKTGRDTEAEALYEEVKNITKNTLGIEHPDYATSLNNLAQFYSTIGQYAKSDPLFVEAKEILAKAVGVNHQFYAATLKGDADMYAKKGDFTKAAPLYMEAKEIFAKTLGKDHPQYAATLFGLAKIYQSENRIPASALLYKEQNEIIRQLIEKSTCYFSEKEMLEYLQTYEENIAQLHSFTQIHTTPALASTSFDNALFYNGYLLENTRRLARAVADADSLTRDTFDRWQGCKRRLSQEYAKPVAERRYITETEEEAESYEKTLRRKLSLFREIRQTPHWQDVRDHLRVGEAAVEFVHYDFYNPKETDSIMYAALVLLPGDSFPHFVPLCEQRELNSLLDIRYPDKRYERTRSGNSLYSLLWQPIESLLKDVSTVYFAPSGALHSVNFNAIMLNTQGDSTLIDRYKLVQLGSMRQLIIATKNSVAGKDALLFGGIRYESDSTAIVTQNDNNGIMLRGGSEEYLPQPGDSAQQITALPPLPATLKEVTFIQQLLEQRKIKTRLFTGFGASEEAFKYFSSSKMNAGLSPRVLHLATHGYFFPDPKKSSQVNNHTNEHIPIFRISEHPFMRSGIVLAGGNYAWQTGKPYKTNMEDGILTAYEISAMSLPNTELVVLSACETGLGSLSGNEGVYGLQRAFKIAGVKYIIMSLWSVPDEATKDLMSVFYGNWLGKKMDISSAFRFAQLEMKKKYKDPEFWAGFVLVQ